MAKKKTDYEFKLEMLQINPKIEILGTYITSKTKIPCRCKVCGHEWEAIPNNLLKQHGCPKCKAINLSKRQTKTLEEVIKNFISTHGNKYNYDKVQYVKSDIKVEIVCPKHGSFWQTPDSHVQGLGCPYCFEERRGTWSLKTLEDFLIKANKVHGNKYDYSKVVYKNCEIPVTIICPIHGEFLQTPIVHTSGHGCVKCTGKEIFNKEDFVNKAHLIHGDRYDYSKVNYIKTEEKVCIICPEHGEFWLTPHDHISSKSGCPKCKQSHGEQLVEQFLKSNNINYISQYVIFSETNISNKAYVDFYIPELNTVIEYNGVLHYIPVEYFGGKLQFEKLQIRDNSVRTYCLENSLLLLEIPYNLTDTEVINLLKSELL